MTRPRTPFAARSLRCAVTHAVTHAMTHAIALVAAGTALSGCALAVPCEADGDCASGAACLGGACQDVLGRDDIEGGREIEVRRDDGDGDVDGFAHRLLLLVPGRLLRVDLAGPHAFVSVVDSKLRHVDHDGFVRSPVGADIAFFDGTPVDPSVDPSAPPREQLESVIASWDPASGDLAAWVHVDAHDITGGEDAHIVVAWGRDLDVPEQ